MDELGTLPLLFKFARRRRDQLALPFLGHDPKELPSVILHDGIPEEIRREYLDRLSELPAPAFGNSGE